MTNSGVYDYKIESSLTIVGINLYRYFLPLARGLGLDRQ